MVEGPVDIEYSPFLAVGSESSEYLDVVGWEVEVAAAVLMSEVLVPRVTLESPLERVGILPPSTEVVAPDPPDPPEPPEVPEMFA